MWDLAVPHRTRPLEQHGAAFPERGATTYHGRVQAFHLSCVQLRRDDREGVAGSVAALSTAGLEAQSGPGGVRLKAGLRRPTVQALLAVRSRKQAPASCCS